MPSGFQAFGNAEGYVGSAVAPIDPTTLNLTGFFRDYSGAPWAGTASGGNSATHSLVAGVAPSVGSALNGHTPAVFNGTTHRLTSTTAIQNYIASGAYRIALLINASAAAAPSGTVYLDPGIFSESGGEWGVTFTTSGVTVFHDDGGYKTASKACAISGWHAVDIVFDGAHLTVSVDGVAGTPTATTTPGAITGGGPRMGSNFNQTVFYAGSIVDVMIAQSALSTVTSQDFIRYYNSRYGLSI